MQTPPTAIPVGDGETVDCSAGCPFVIYADDWDHHLRWHMDARSTIKEAKQMGLVDELPTVGLRLDPSLGAHIRIEIPDERWEHNDSLDIPDDRLSFDGVLTINGVPMHLEAWRVFDDTGIQEHNAFPDDLNSLSEAVGADGPFQTATIRGDQYVLVLSPYC